MDMDKNRALARERMRRHRAIRAGVDKLMGKIFLPRISKAIRDGDASSDSLSSKKESSDESQDEGSAMGTRAPSRKTLTPAAKDRTKRRSERSFSEVIDFESMICDIKASPPSSIASRNSVSEHPETTQPLAQDAALMPENIEPTMQHAMDYMTQASASMPTDTNVLHMIFESIDRLAQEQSKLAGAVNRMSSVLEQITGEGSARKRETFEHKYDLELPFATRELFLIFDQKIASDPDLRSALIHSLYQKYDAKRSVTKNITTILRKFIARDVALQYTAQKNVAGKFVFKDTTFSACLLETIDTLADDKHIPALPDNEYYVHLGSVLSNAKDWGVARNQRTVGTKRRRGAE